MIPATDGGDGHARCPVCGAPWPHQLGPPVDALHDTGASCTLVDRVHQAMLIRKHSCTHRLDAFLDARTRAGEIDRMEKILLVFCALYTRRMPERQMAEMTATYLKHWRRRRDGEARA